MESEIDKLFNPGEYIVTNSSIALQRSMEELFIHDIEQMMPEHARNLNDEVYKNACDEEGNYSCAGCGKKSVTKALF